MRIAYLCYWDIRSDDGVARKIAGQTELWRDEGHDVLLAPVEPAAPTERLRATVRAMRAISRFRPDVVYVRYDLFLPPAWALAHRFPVVVELNTDDRAEWRLRSRLAALYNELNRRALLQPAAGTVAVSHELAPRSGRSLVLGNGLDPRRVRELPAPAHAGAHVVFIGSARQPWQGFDKVAALAAALPDVTFDVIGPSTAELPHAPPNVLVHGRLAPAAYEPLLERADVALGTLALHRKGMNEASPLKVREYLLAGIPTVLAYDDTDLRDIDPPWLLRLPNTERNAVEHAAEIGLFVESMRGVRVPRDLAEQRLGAPAKEARRLAFLREVCS